ncbi:MAG: helix-turn-helix domain-containing protein [Acidobacteriota bacterium]|nr:helix-turn-helix domain-containing protein [Acidobacteriota bacterium]
MRAKVPVSKPDANRSNLKAIRTEQGMAAAELANLTGISRQTVYAIEDGSFVPNTLVALKLAKALRVSVEDLFCLDEPENPAESVDAELLSTHPESSAKGQLVRLVDSPKGKLAIPVHDAFSYLPSADGFVEGKRGRTLHVTSTSRGEQRNLREKGRPIVVAGCDPALSLLRDAAFELGIEIVPVPAASRQALALLAKGSVHLAGSHLLDPSSGQYNVALARHIFPNGGVRVLNFAIWETGLVTQPRNPKRLRSIGDLAEPGVSIVNREKGSGSRALLDSALKSAGLQNAQLRGYEHVAYGHLQAAFSVASGWADCCIATQSAARCFGLGFVPLRTERFDITFPEPFLASKLGEAVADLLNRNSLRQRLESIAGYDTSHTGRLIV